MSVRLETSGTISLALMGHLLQWCLPYFLVGYPLPNTAKVCSILLEWDWSKFPLPTFEQV